MPPRRSARSTTVEPEPQPNSIATKRKRNQAPADTNPGKENVVLKPARSSVGPSSKGRTSTRPRVSLKEVGESDEGDEGGDVADSPPPVKKSRPSPEVEDPEEDDDDDMYAEEEPAVKPKGRKSASGKKGKHMPSEDDSEWDEPPKAKAASKGRRSTSKPKPTPARKSVGRKLKLEEDPNSGDDAGMNVSTSNGRKSKPTAPPPSSKAPAHQSSEEVEDSDIEPMPMKKKPSKPKAPAKRVAASSDDADPEKSGNNTSAAVTQDDDVEESLLDPVPPSLSLSRAGSLSQVQPPDEPKGPKARLTIHKMALVNFKSYAGRQEIGPFHKVR